MDLKKTCMEVRIDQLTEENMILKDKVEVLQDRIDKVIEYILNNREPVDERNGEVLYWLSDEFDEEKILDILKGR